MNIFILGHPSANPLLLAIEAATGPNSYLLERRSKRRNYKGKCGNSGETSGNKATIVKKRLSFKIPRHISHPLSSHQLATQSDTLQEEDKRGTTTGKCGEHAEKQAATRPPSSRNGSAQDPTSYSTTQSATS
ncbi:hypothetical protein HO173_001324 [Letharia columbiana]|uniref:Uncharacterized protein n=1 Tax=Letharia columbiana TaxID=112416 RepID=A0A8H6L9D8_9LECA|nr:uncharacterized protein HO173_001324 [Letharia columbiana]KAF6240652.1 hypothetical protein HO173_001324 [Letharia columbiana]